MKILVIEDDPDIVSTLLFALKEAGHIAYAVTDGEAGVFSAQTSEHDLILMDYNLPKINGREAIKQIRDSGILTPIIMTTVHGEVDEKIDLLNIGVDDYITKPFALSELLARIKAVLRRPKNWEGGILKLKTLELDSNKFLVTKNGQRIALSSKEFSLLEYLLRNKGYIMSRQSIMEHVWDENADPFSNTIEVHIRNLRRKLENDGNKIIFTVPNRGYKLDEAM